MLSLRSFGELYAVVVTPCLRAGDWAVTGRLVIVGATGNADMDEGIARIAICSSLSDVDEPLALVRHVLPASLR